ncbi:DUF488 domain-containing protein [Mycoplana ramosa]|uniref:DUF488 domain-containing protein n=1 Tax=Mycoplana ramosa TaxID=40837 RepID=A0ABW3YXY1_MYCRA
MSNITVKRIYASSEPGDGTRVLVDRLWPRGISKAKANIDLWLKDISPSDDLRKRFHAKPESWDAFRSAYAEELQGEATQAAAAELRALLRKGPVTLLYAAKDERYNNAVALKEWLDRHG